MTPLLLAGGLVLIAWFLGGPVAVIGISAGIAVSALLMERRPS